MYDALCNAKAKDPPDEKRTVWYGFNCKICWKQLDWQLNSHSTIKVVATSPWQRLGSPLERKRDHHRPCPRCKGGGFTSCCGGLFGEPVRWKATIFPLRRIGRSTSAS